MLLKATNHRKASTGWLYSSGVQFWILQPYCQVSRGCYLMTLKITIPSVNVRINPFAAISRPIPDNNIPLLAMKEISAEERNARENSKCLEIWRGGTDRLKWWVSQQFSFTLLNCLRLHPFLQRVEFPVGSAECDYFYGNCKRNLR